MSQTEVSVSSLAHRALDHPGGEDHQPIHEGQELAIKMSPCLASLLISHSGWRSFSAEPHWDLGPSGDYGCPQRREGQLQAKKRFFPLFLQDNILTNVLFSL